MLKNLQIILLVVFTSVPLSHLNAAVQDEQLIIEELILITKENLLVQQKLLHFLLEFKEAKKAFMADSESGKLATTLVKKAMHLYAHVEREHLSHLFSSELITELTFYTQVGIQAGCE